MTVQITALELGGLDDLGAPKWAHWLEFGATGGISAAWDKTVQKDLGKAARKVAKETGPALRKVAQKILKPAVCAAGKALKDDKSGYGIALKLGASVLCPEKKKEEPKPWYGKPLVIGAVAVGAGLMLGVLFSR